MRGARKNRLIVDDCQHARSRRPVRLAFLATVLASLCLSIRTTALAQDLAPDYSGIRGAGAAPFVLTAPTGAAAAQTTPSNKQPSAATVDLSHLNLPALRQAGQVIFNVHMVTPGLIRGGQPSLQGLDLLKQAGVKTVVNLRNEDKIVTQEAAQTRSLGLNYVNIPMNVFNRPTDADISRFLAIVSNPDNQPVYVHCLQGQDRTGTMCGIYRMTAQGWPFEATYNEMLGYGFKPVLGQLKQTVIDYSGRSAVNQASAWPLFSLPKFLK